MMIEVLTKHLEGWRDRLKRAGDWNALDCWALERLTEAAKEHYRDEGDKPLGAGKPGESHA